ncbi:MAG TPA: hypothetical protein VGD37_21400 [Kofleriaceae bacterium]|jgi:hypothetical protein
MYRRGRRDVDAAPPDRAGSRRIASRPGDHGLPAEQALARHGSMRRHRWRRRRERHDAAPLPAGGVRGRAWEQRSTAYRIGRRGERVASAWRARGHRDAMKCLRACPAPRSIPASRRVIRASDEYAEIKHLIIP